MWTVVAPAIKQTRSRACVVMWALALRSGCGAMLALAHGGRVCWEGRQAGRHGAAGASSACWVGSRAGCVRSSLWPVRCDWRAELAATLVVLCDLQGVGTVACGAQVVGVAAGLLCGGAESRGGVWNGAQRVGRHADYGCRGGAGRADRLHACSSRHRARGRPWKGWSQVLLLAGVS